MVWSLIYMNVIYKYPAIWAIIIIIILLLYYYYYYIIISEHNFNQRLPSYVWSVW